MIIKGANELYSVLLAGVVMRAIGTERFVRVENIQKDIFHGLVFENCSEVGLELGIPDLAVDSLQLPLDLGLHSEVVNP